MTVTTLSVPPGLGISITGLSAVMTLPTAWCTPNSESLSVVRRWGEAPYGEVRGAGSVRNAIAVRTACPKLSGYEPLWLQRTVIKSVWVLGVVRDM